MDYLRNLGSAAASSLLQRSGVAYPFILGDKISSYDGKSIWTLHDAIKRDDTSQVSVFVYEANQRSDKLLVAKNALKKLRTIRHPDIIKFVDVFETETAVFIVTERVQPLESAIKEQSNRLPGEREEWLAWGLQRIATALSFINHNVKATHGNVTIDSVFIAGTGEWRLGGFELTSSPSDSNSILYSTGISVLNQMGLTSPPEVQKSGWQAVKDEAIGALDAYCIGILIHSLFNPNSGLPATVSPPHPQPPASSRGSIPPYLFPSFKKLLHPNPRARLRPKEFLDLGMGISSGDHAGFFTENKLYKICSSLDNFALSNDTERAVFLRDLKNSLGSFPISFATQRVVPSLISALDQGGASSSTILSLVFTLGRLVPPAEYNAIVSGPIIKLFPRPDRSIRMALLEGMPEFIDQVNAKDVTDNIWPHLQSGFSDTVPVVREATVRSVIHIYSKLSDRVLNNDLMRHLAKMQSDPEASIRTNTCILIGRLGSSLGYNTKRKVLVPAFAKALKDGFLHARVAGIAGLMANAESFEPEEIAGRVLPVVALALIDKEKLVRDPAFKAAHMFMKRLETHASNMADTVLADDAKQQVNQLAPLQASIVNSATGAAGALAGWAMSSIGRKIASGDMQSSAAVSGSIDAEPLRPPSSTESLDHKPAALTQAGHMSKAMQLVEPRKDTVANWIEEDASQTAGDAWGEGDLMDVNADTGDWGSFETAPPAVAVEFIEPQVNVYNTSKRSNMNIIEVEASDTGTQGVTKALHSPATDSLDDVSNLATPVNSPSPGVSVTKETKAAEIARRKEERRQRIAQLKEQTKASKAL